MTTTAHNAAEQRRVRGTRGSTTGSRSGRLRYAILALLFVGITINYVDRATVSVALPHMRSDLHISDAMSGVIMSAFFWTYAAAQMPGGWLADKLGSRILLGAASLWWGLVTCLTGLIRGAGFLIALRLLLGVGEAPSFPTSAKVVSRWFPRSERSFASATFNNGNAVGGALSLPLVTLVVGLLGWRWAFAAAGVLGMLWAIGWWALYRDPRKHPKLRAGELAYIEGDQEEAAASETAPGAAATVRWKDLFRYRVVWAMLLGFFCVNFVAYFFITWFPTYLSDTYHLDLTALGLFGMIPGIASAVGGWLGGLFSDWLVRRGTPLTKARKIPLVGGLLGTSVIAVAIVAPSVGSAIAALSASYFCSTFAAASVWSLPSDVAPTSGHVASLGGIMNTAGNLAGVVSPILIGVLTGMSNSFVLPLGLAGCVALVGAAIYAFLLPKVRRIEPTG
jgi:ACS family glucarate transporter-like MFS transporter